MLDGVTVFQYPTPAVVSCMLYAVLDAVCCTRCCPGDGRLALSTRTQRVVLLLHRPVPAPTSWVPVSCGRRRPYTTALGRICTLQYRCLRGLNSTRGHVSNRSTLPGKREGSTGCAGAWQWQRDVPHSLGFGLRSATASAECIVPPNNFASS